MRIEQGHFTDAESGCRNRNIDVFGKMGVGIIKNDTMVSAYRLRHQVFCEELRWVPWSDDGLERDVYDAHAEHFGVYKQGSVLSYLRLVSPNYRYMLEKEFSSLVGPDHAIRKNSDTREVSRLCVRSNERSTKIKTEIGSVGVSMLLYRSVYQWCVAREVRYLYLVVEYKVLRLLKIFGFPCELIGEPTRMPDGVVAAAAIMDWRDFEEKNLWKRPELVHWFSRSQEYQDVSPLQLPVSGSRHPAFS